MPRRPAFDAKTLERLARVEEVDIETKGGRLTTIWVILVGTEVYVRSVRGERGRWYQRLKRNPLGALRVGRSRIAVRATLADDAETVLAVSFALQQKYRDSASLQSMLRPQTLRTTLRLEPAK